MSLIIAIFSLVFVTELISWIGKSVLLEFVRSTTMHLAVVKCPNCSKRMPGLRDLPEDFLLQLGSEATKAQIRDTGSEEGVAADKCPGPVCQVGETEEERRQGAGRPGEAQ